ncbi:MAG TPA: DUF4080 domain-containing protein [Acholeplasmataceae bacterium]|nr:DUF4080 domain-containing protein [Acholeplasmataceae bacterium]
MKILLIGINLKYIHPAIGIHQLIANSRYPVSFLEFTIKDKNETIIQAMEKEDYDLIGFSVYIWNIEKIKEIIKVYSKNTMILLGGPEASYRPDILHFDDRVAFIIKNEGEEAFNELIEYLNNKRKLNQVSNLYYKEKEEIRYTYDCLLNLKYVKHDITLIKDYKNRNIYLEASRGCPYHCSYCLSSLDNKVRFFALDKVKSEILFTLKNKAKAVKFLDRTFNLKQEKMREIVELIRDNDNNLTTFQFEIVGDLLDEETIKLLQTVRRGQIRFEIGIQSTNPTVTKSVNRKQDFEKLKENILKIKNNIIVHLDLIAGLPYEDKQSFIRTFNETFLLFPDELQLGFLKELQGTEISLTKELHKYQFSEKPPYEIEKNKYLNKADLDEIRIVERMINRYFNTNSFPRTMEYLFILKKLNPYQTFLEIGKLIESKNIKNMQPNTVALNLYEALAYLDKEELLYIIKQDYLYKPIKPMIWWERKITREERQKVYNSFIVKYPELDIESLYRYSHLEKFKDEYCLTTYKPLARYFIKITNN